MNGEQDTVRPRLLFPVHLSRLGIMRLISIQIGTPRVYGVPGSDDPMDRVFTSAIGKEPVAGRVWAAQLGLSGDAVADRKEHGGADQAVLAYSAEHYARVARRSGCARTWARGRSART